MQPKAKVVLKHQERCLGCYNCVFACSLELFDEISAVRSAVSIKPCSPRDRFEVTFCTGCDYPPCIEACEPQALQQDKDGLLTLAKPSECEECKTFDCIEACIIGALSLDPHTSKPILCTQCGKCAEICPHEVITYEEEG